MNQGSGSPRLRRAYFECRHGQLHVHNAIPAGGGFDELTTLVCVHASGTTGRAFLELSRLLGTSRSIYSPDIPGCGESDGPPKALNVAGYAESLCDFLDSMRFRQVDLLGVRAGAAIAAEIAIARPKVVRRIVMVGAPALDDVDRKTRRDLSPPEGLSPGAQWVRASLNDWKAQTRLPLVTQPVMVLRPKDQYWEAGGRVAKLVPGARVIDLPEHDRWLVENQAPLVAKHLAGFLAAS
jgi:pimeloyl-ACP methyl ester carboxylesterase